ncbi:unnamed protein product [Cylicocyclus nassatus]|uniref:Uncharacterized protein n=1 Tax=Cylicocyclus nassatus TaxID=53992 RepID=A0AA36H5R4_CYLNA|nr:unnamed protein product [Cylicocyclus nassatus]
MHSRKRFERLWRCHQLPSPIGVRSRACSNVSALIRESDDLDPEGEAVSQPPPAAPSQHPLLVRRKRTRHRMNVNPFHNEQQPKLENVSIGEKLASLHQEMASLRMECDRLINKHLLVEKTLSEGCILCPNPDTSSAYNTGGESCRSNSITPDGVTNPPQPPPVSVEDVSLTLQRSPRILHRSKNMPVPPSNSVSPQNVRAETRKEAKPMIPQQNVPEVVEVPTRLHTPGYADTPSSSVESSVSPLRRFAPLHIVPRKESEDCAKRFRIPSLSIVARDESRQNRKDGVMHQNLPMPKFFRSVKTKTKLYVFDKPVEEMTENSDDHAAGPSVSMPQQSQQNEAIVYKWKVKRRCDGSRYVVKRPARSQILKKRAAQLIRERTGISTDDDAMSELKLGHFHTREERKKHLEEERKRKIRNQQKLIESKISPSDQMIVQLSQRKMQRRKEKMLLDGFVTTQEVLSQRNPDSSANHGILSVTTV